ncbi:MAG: DUF1573 domain-containing protein [Planctomycetes bacterium]|nr:DUF1573 domain-containing protein [Planctomycetota bacterium]
MSNHRFFGVLALAVACGLSSAQDQKPEPPKAVQPGGVAPKAGTGGNSWFPVTSRDLGTYYGQGDATGVFTFKNPTDKAVVWSTLSGSCQCAKVTIRVGGRVYELSSKPNPNRLTRVTKVPGQPDQIEQVQQITIEAGQEGEVEAHLDMNGITGPKQAHLDVHTSDPALPQFKLNFNANGAQLFAISPNEVQLNKMTWSESREFTVTVTSPLQKDWKIVRMDDAKAFSATWEKVENNGVVSWVIKGKYGPVDGETGGGGVLKFTTDVQGGASFNVRVLAFVQGPLEVKPGAFLTLGLIRKGTSLKKEVVFEPNDGKDLQAVSLKFEKLTLGSEFISATSRKDGNKLVVELAVSDQAPAGLLKGDLVVELNHPLVKDKKIMFNGFIR